MPVLSLPEATLFCAELRARGQRLVLTNGVFDLLHLGHVDYLEKARALGEALIVGVNADASVPQLKGQNRPLIPAHERAAMLAALRCVDAVVVFDEPTAIPLLQTLRPNIYVKGGDYAHKPLPEYATAQAIGAQVVLIDFLPDHSTTDLINKIIKSNPS